MGHSGEETTNLNKQEEHDKIICIFNKYLVWKVPSTCQVYLSRINKSISPPHFWDFGR